MEARILFQLVPIDFDSQARTVRNGDWAVNEVECCGDDVVGLFNPVGVDRMIDHSLGRYEVQACGGGDAKFAVAVHAETKIEGLADFGQLQCWVDSTPEMNVAEHDVKSLHPDRIRDLFEGNAGHIGRQGNGGAFANAGHTLQPPGRVFAEQQIVVRQAIENPG